jgi:hypothetical protein
MAVTGDVRGHCGECARWFPMTSDTVRAMMQAVCPFCSGAADQIEQRCGDVRIAIDIATPPVSAAVAPDTAAI